MRKDIIVLICIAVIVVAAGIILAITSAPDSKPAGQAADPQALARSHSQTLGPEDAKVTIVEFGDYQCPACGFAHPIVKEFFDKHQDQSIRFVFRNFPLTSIHKNAFLASEAAEAASEQNRFWDMHNKLFDTQKEWENSTTPRDIFIQYAKDLGLNVDQFTESLNKRAFKEIIETDIKDGEALGVNSTPTFYVNGQKLSKIPTLEELEQMASAILSAPETQTPNGTATTSSSIPPTTTPAVPQ
jgi:protein-disulfide isomerase